MLSQESLRKCNMKYDLKKPKTSIIGQDFTEFTRLSDNLAMTEEKVEKLIKDNQDLKALLEKQQLQQQEFMNKFLPFLTELERKHNPFGTILNKPQQIQQPQKVFENGWKTWLAC